MTRIARIVAREVLDSRGNPTVEVEIGCDDGMQGSAIAPSGASTGAAEACELRDGESHRYDGRGVRRAVAHVREIIAPALLGTSVADQATLDRHLLELDGTPRKTRLGANAMLAVSLAAAHAAAASTRLPLYEHLRQLLLIEHESFAVESEQLAKGTTVAPPRAVEGPRLPLPMTNMISGGLHAGGNLDFQDVLVIPRGATTMGEALEWLVRIYRRLGELLTERGYEGRLVGDEGGFGPRLRSNREAVELVVRAIEEAHLQPGEDAVLALDVAATHFFDGTHYRLAATGDQSLTSDEMIDQLAKLVEDYPIASIEDGLADEDWPGWQRLTARLGKRVHLVGDDLFTTNVDRLSRGIALDAGNSVLIKVNQIGTLTETFRCLLLAESAGYQRVVSARSGETEDTTIADLAVASAAEHIKIGAIVRGERLAKYNRLLRIEEQIA